MQRLLVPAAEECRPEYSGCAFNILLAWWEVFMINSLEGAVMGSPGGNLEPAIARIWRGRTTRERADEYARYLYEYGIKPLERKALGVQLFREDRETESEFVTISYWESVAAMSRFAGNDPRRIHHLERDPEFLIELPDHVQILDIIARHWRPSQP
jgi:hypothetical protein